MDNIFRIDSISELHEAFEYDKPKHPLITLFDLSKISGVKLLKNTHAVSGLYTIALKLNCPFKYGRQYYDFSEGSLIFAAPEQVVKIDAEDYELNQEGWMLCFHPDLIRKSEMGRKIDEFTFFHMTSMRHCICLKRKK